MTSPSSSLSVADIFREGFGEYVRLFGPFPKQHYNVANAIIRCRTEALGSHLFCCDSCGNELQLNNSCRNRHCPQCQALNSARWADKRMQETLPTQYYHVVFTLPSRLNPYALRNQAAFYPLLFRAVSETLLQLGKDDARLGALIGVICVLHTWGQNLMDHPHIHCIVPGGGIADDKSQWKSCGEKILFPVAVMRTMLRGKFMSFFREALDKGEIACIPNQTQSVEQLITTLYKIDWVVYAKRPFTNPESVIKYLSAYTHRVAISNKRLIKLENGMVTFGYKDYADNNLPKTMTISVVEFIRRFMMHVLPKGFMRIRYYGFYGNAVKKKLLPLIRALCLKALGQASSSMADFFQDTIDLAEEIRRFCCPACGAGRLVNMGAVMRTENVLAYGGIA
jgi:predicted RNA-binding Zn-ribbon protein involved in translation (DUF1610 family)